MRIGHSHCTVAVIVCAIGGGAWAQETPPLDRLRFEATLESTTIVPGEPVLVTLTLSNPGSLPVLVNTSDVQYSDSGSYKFQVSSAEAGPYRDYLTYFARKRLSPNSHSDHGKRPAEQFGAGTTLLLQDLIFPACSFEDHYPFTKAGTYFIKYKYCQKNPTADVTDELVTAKPIKMVVHDPPNDSASVFSKTMLDSDREYLKFALTGGPITTRNNHDKVSALSTDDIRKELRDLIDQTKGSSCCQYVRYLLARSFRRPEELKEATGIYEDIVRGDDFPLKVHGYLELATCVGLQDNLAGHLQLMEFIKEKFPGSAALNACHHTRWMRTK